MSRRLSCVCGVCRKCKRREGMRKFREEHRDLYNERMRQWYVANAAKVRSWAKRYRDENLESVREYDRERGKTKVRDPEKERARRVIAHMVEDGFERPPCEVCGAPKAEAHHEDYSRPRDVHWLCHAHHMELHRTVGV